MNKNTIKESVNGGVKTANTKADKFEVEIAKNIKQFFSKQVDDKYKNLEVQHYEGDDSKFYSDVKITNPKTGMNLWVEVKLNKYANLGGPSFKYVNREWTCSTTDESNPLTKYYLDLLTQNSEKFINFCKQRLGDDFELPTDLPDVIDEWKKAGMIEDTDNDVLFITEKIPLENFGEKIAKYYQTAKKEPVYYIQIDDDLYIIDSRYNPLDLQTKDHKELKPLSEAHKNGRIQFRAKGIEKIVDGKKKYFYSIVCDIKNTKDTEKTEETYDCSFKSSDKFPIVSYYNNDDEVNNDIKDNNMSDVDLMKEAMQKAAEFDDIDETLDSELDGDQTDTDDTNVTDDKTDEQPEILKERNTKGMKTYDWSKDFKFTEDVVSDLVNHDMFGIGRYIQVMLPINREDAPEYGSYSPEPYDILHIRVGVDVDKKELEVDRFYGHRLDWQGENHTSTEKDWSDLPVISKDTVLSMVSIYKDHGVARKFADSLLEKESKIPKRWVNYYDTMRKVFEAIDSGEALSYKIVFLEPEDPTPEYIKERKDKHDEIERYVSDALTRYYDTHQYTGD